MKEEKQNDIVTICFTLSVLIALCVIFAITANKHPERSHTNIHTIEEPKSYEQTAKEKARTGKIGEQKTITVGNGGLSNRLGSINLRVHLENEWKIISSDTIQGRFMHPGKIIYILEKE